MEKNIKNKEEKKKDFKKTMIFSLLLIRLKATRIPL